MAKKYNPIDALVSSGIAFDDAMALRRISMTLQRWHELECGDGNDYGSWCITRGRSEVRHGQHADGHGPHRVFLHDDDGKPFLEHHHYAHGRGKDTVSYSSIPDRERGALRRLAAIMARYPGFASYVQGDPRGAALYILRPADLNGLPAADGKPIAADVLSSVYSRGIAVYK